MSQITILIKNGHLVDPLANRDGKFDIRLSNGKITEVAKNISPNDGDNVLDAIGCYVFPGLIDMHVHLREPGGEAQETIASGTRAAPRLRTRRCCCGT